MLGVGVINYNPRQKSCYGYNIEPGDWGKKREEVTSGSLPTTFDNYCVLEIFIYGVTF